MILMLLTLDRNTQTKIGSCDSCIQYDTTANDTRLRNNQFKVTQSNQVDEQVQKTIFHTKYA